MPELPEVETIRRDLEKFIVNKKIIDILIRNQKVIKEPSPQKLKSLLLNSVCTKIQRRGKLLIFQIKAENNQEYFLTIHLKMTGQLIFGEYDSQSRLSFKLSDGNFLNYNDQRLFGELRLVKDWRALKFLAQMGPEPLDQDFTAAEFKKRIKKRHAKTKPLLLDQSFIAGLGNIYAAEALFLSGINPTRRADTLSNGKIRLLFKNIRRLLRKAIESRGTSFDTYRDGRGEKGKYTRSLFVYGRQGQSCLVCKTPIKRVVLGGRGTYYCVRCQK